MKILIAVLLVLVCFIVLLVVEAVVAMGGKREPFKNPDHGKVLLISSKKPLTYVVIGDSTSAGQGAVYGNGIAIQSAKHLSKSYNVSMINYSVSGAKVKDLLDKQVQPAIASMPDIVLIAVGANDVTHLTSLGEFNKNLSILIEKFLTTNCNIKVIVTGSPDMGAPPRIAQPLRFLAGIQSSRINKVVDTVVKKYGITFARVQEKTGNLFRKNPALYAADMFHPNDEGYVVWNTVINASIDEAIAKQPSHCKP